MFRQKRGVALLILRCHISGKIYSTLESSYQQQIKLPKLVLTYALEQCLNTL